MGRHEADVPTAGAPPDRIRSARGWVLGGAIVAVIAAAIWALGAEAEAPPPGIFGAAARPGIFDLPTTTITTLPTTVTTVATTLPAAPVTAPPTTTAQSTTTTLAPLVLEPAGLGPIDLGAPYDEAVGAVTERLGAPAEDTGWIGATSDFGTCPGTVVRMVRWASLRLVFGDGPTEFGSETRHLFYYSQSRVGADEALPLVTAEGIGIGATVADLRSAYAERLVVESTLRFGTTFFVQPTGAGLLSGTLSNSSDAGEVTSLGGGFGCAG